GVSRLFIRKAFLGVAVLAIFVILDVVIVKRLPTSFLPEEDYGFLFLNLQLPPAASLARTDEAARKVENILAETKGVRFDASIVGFSLLTRVSASYNAFFFVALSPWEDRKAHALQARALLKRLNERLAREVPEGNAFLFMPPSIPGLGNAGGFSMWLQDRSGGTVDFLDKNLKRFLEAARKRPELS